MAWLCLAKICFGLYLGVLYGGVNSSVLTDESQDSNHLGSCVCHQHCGDQTPNTSLLLEVISKMSSMQTSDNIMFERVLASIDELRSLLEIKTSSLENKIAAQDRVLESVENKVETDGQAIIQLQESLDQLSPPADYKPKYRVFHVRSSSGVHRLSQDEARAMCLSKGAKLATVAQLEAAWKLGMDVCACGWLDDGSSRYPRQWPRSGCGTGPAGLGVCESRGYSGPILRDAYCFA